VLAGEIIVKPIAAFVPRADLRVPGGEIHHTIGTMFLKGEKIARIRRVIDDYPHFPEIYGPDIVMARQVTEGNSDHEVFIRVRKHFVITVVLNITTRVRWTELDATHAMEHSTSTHIGEAQDPENPDAGERADDRGFLWRYDSFWRLEETPQGVLVEHEIISLSRRAPASLRFVLRPLLQRLPQESMYQSVLATRQTLEKRKDSLAVSMNSKAQTVSAR